jgi:drug/metabolite transporter (DMT)-like permease
VSGSQARGRAQETDAPSPAATRTSTAPPSGTSAWPAAPEPSTRRQTLLATFAILGMTACWGSTFFLIKDLLDRVPVLDFLAVRFAIAAVALFLLAPRALGRLTREQRKYAVVLGLLYGFAQVLQTAGLAHTPASVSGFITGLYVICTPLLAAALLRTRISRATWAAVVLALAGLAVLTLTGFSVGYGEAVTLASAVLYALHIVGLGAWTDARAAMGMTIVQLAVIALLCFVFTAPDGLVFPGTAADWLSVVYMAVFAGALALAGQTWAQAHLPPTRSAIIMSMEPVFAAFFAVLLGGEALTLRMGLGGALVLAAMLLVEVAPRRKIEAEVPHIAV